MADPNLYTPVGALYALGGPLHGRSIPYHQGRTVIEGRRPVYAAPWDAPPDLLPDMEPVYYMLRALIVPDGEESAYEPERPGSTVWAYVRDGLRPEAALLLLLGILVRRDRGEE